MLTGTGLSQYRHKSERWAILLFAGYWIMFAAELSLIRFIKGEDGRWVATTEEQPALWLSLVILAVTVLTIVISVRYVISWWRERKIRRWLWGDHELDGRDVLHIVAWMHVYQAATLILYGIFMEGTYFAGGTVGGVFESALYQLFLLFLIPLWFRGRWEEIGIKKPVKLWRMILTLLVLLLLISQAMDVLVTEPVADWFGLSLSSEREQQIAQEIAQAKETNILAAWASVLVIGILVPIAEELLFRGVVQTYLVKRIGAFAGIFLSSMWFALLHMDVALLAPLFVIGIGLGFVRHRYQSIWGAVILHAINNMTGVLYYFQ